MFFRRSQNIFEPKIYLEIYLYRIPCLFLHAKDRLVIVNQLRTILTNILLVSHQKQSSGGVL